MKVVSLSWKISKLTNQITLDGVNLDGASSQYTL